MTKAVIKDRVTNALVYALVCILISVSLIFFLNNYYLSTLVLVIGAVIYKMAKPIIKDRTIALSYLLIGLAIVCATLIVSFYNNYRILPFYTNFYSFFFISGILLISAGIYWMMVNTSGRVDKAIFYIASGMPFIGSIILIFFVYKNYYILSAMVLVLIGSGIMLTLKITNSYERYRKALKYILLVILVLALVLLKLAKI